MASIFSLTALGASKSFAVPNLCRQQAAAVCCRRNAAETEVLLITGRGNDRWGVPKGTIELGENSAEAAAREAFEEAGVRGLCEPTPIGVFHYFKSGRIVPYEVHVHLLHVHDVTEDFPEVGQRSLDWAPLRHPSGLVARHGLARLLGDLGSAVDRHLDFKLLRITLSSKSDARSSSTYRDATA